MVWLRHALFCQSLSCESRHLYCIAGFCSSSPQFTRLQSRVQDPKQADSESMSHMYGKRRCARAALTPFVYTSLLFVTDSEALGSLPGVLFSLLVHILLKKTIASFHWTVIVVNYAVEIRSLLIGCSHSVAGARSACRNFLFGFKQVPTPRLAAGSK